VSIRKIFRKQRRSTKKLRRSRSTRSRTLYRGVVLYNFLGNEDFELTLRQEKDTVLSDGSRP